MKKLAVVLLIFISVLTVSVNCFAAPSVVESGNTGNTSSLIVIKKPETSVSSTTKKNYTLTAVTLSGTEVSLYSYNPSTGLFELKKDAYGNPMTKIVGASGIYLQEINLAEETNYMLVRAQCDDGRYQNVRLNITLLNQSLLDSIKGFAANFRTVFGR